MKKTDRRAFLQTAGTVAAGMASSVGAQAFTPVRTQAPPASGAPRTMGTRFRELLHKGEPFENVAVYDVASARMVEILGFQSLYLASTAAAEAHGVPDWGLLSLSEQVDFFGRIAQNVGIPGVADIDINGDVLVFYRSVQAFERAGVAAVHFGDAVASAGRRTAMHTVGAMVDRIHAARDASPDLVVSARCQGLEIEEIDKTIERAAAYARAGAETVWVLPAPTLETLPRFADAIKVPLTAQFFADTPQSKAKESKVTVMCYPDLVQRIAQGAVYDALMEFKSTGMWIKASRGQRNALIVPEDIRNRIRRTPEYTDAAAKYHAQ